MILTAITLTLLLHQAEPVAAEPAPVPAAAAATTPEAAPPVSAPPRGKLSPEELQRQLERIRKLPPSEQAEGWEELHQRLSGPVDPKAPKGDQALSDAEHAKQVARLYFQDLITGDARGMTLLSGFPFQLEDRRLEMPEELHKEWLKNLRAKRTDLITLYDLEVLSPAEMDKKYGHPPARLAALTRTAGKIFLVVANLSGHPAVAVLRQAGSAQAWQVVGFTD